jgi:DNA-binding winged helix-turn-helix (wHTH) protein
MSYIFRKSELSQVIQYIHAGDSCLLFGIGSVGKSNLMRSLTRADILEQYLGDGWSQNIVVYVDAHKLVEQTEWGLYELLLHQVIIELTNRGIELGIISQLNQYYSQLTAQETMNLALRYVDRAVSLVCSQQQRKLVFLLDDFDDLLTKLPVRTFQALRALRDDQKKNLMFVVSTRTPLDQLRSLPDEIEPFEEILVSNTIWLGAYDPKDARKMLDTLVDRYQVTFNESIKDEILRLSGGHPGLLRSVFLSLKENPEQEPASLDKDARVVRECERIWNSISKECQPMVIAVIRGSTGRLDLEELAVLQTQKLVGEGGEKTDHLFSPLLQAVLEKSKGISDLHIRIDRKKRLVWVDGRKTQPLTPKEFLMIDYLEMHRGEVCSRDDLIAYMYPDQSAEGVSNDALDSVAQRLRRNLETDPKNPKFIRTVFGVGYMLEDGPL